MDPTDEFNAFVCTGFGKGLAPVILPAADHEAKGQNLLWLVKYEFGSVFFL